MPPRKVLLLAVPAAIVFAAGALAASGLKANGYHWSGKAAHGAKVQFDTNLRHTKIKAIGINGPRVICTSGSQSTAAPIFLRKITATRVRHGRFSTALDGLPGPFGAQSGSVKGKFSGRRASGTVKWSLVSTSYHCTPSGGTFKWTARRGAKTYPGSG
jgi:hypothetical protein